MSKIKRTLTKKTKASKLKEQPFVYVLQPKTGHQRNEFPFTDFRSIGVHIVENAWPINKYLVRQLGTKKPKFFIAWDYNCSRLPIPYVQTTSKEWKLDPEFIKEHDDLQARASESDYEMPIFDSGGHELDNHNSPELTVKRDLANDGTCINRGTIQEGSPEIFPRQKVREPIRITTWSLMRKQIRSSWAPLMKIPAEQNMMYPTILNRTVMTTTDIKFQVCFGMLPGTTTYTRHGLWKKFTERIRSNYVPTHKAASITSGTASDCWAVFASNSSICKRCSPVS